MRNRFGESIAPEAHAGIRGPGGLPEIRGPEGLPEIRGPEGLPEISRGRKPPVLAPLLKAPEGRKNLLP